MTKANWLLAAMLGFAMASDTRAANHAIQDFVIKIDGSSTVFPITEAVAEEFQKANRGVKVTVGISGTGGGFKKFTKGETHISDASRQIKPPELKECKKNGIDFIELPVAYDGLAVLVNKENNWCNTITTAELKKIWEPAAEGKVMKWSDVRAGWPDEKMTLYGPGTDSGTFDYFTEAINHKEKASRPDYIPSEDDNILVQGVARDKYALGYFGFAYYESNKDKLKLVAVDDGDDSNGKGAIYPSLETVSNGTYRPLSRPIFIYVSAEAAKNRNVRNFVLFYLANAKELVAEVGYIPLPDKIYKALVKRFEDGVTGTVYKDPESQTKTLEELYCPKEGNKRGKP